MSDQEPTRVSPSNAAGSTAPTGGAGGHPTASVPAADPGATVGGAGPAAVPAAGPVPGYEVLGELGKGAMGVVYKARHARLNRVVALKMVLGGRAGEKELIRFLAEAESVAAVRHENVVQVYDYGDAGGRPYMALEYCPGGSLADRQRDGAALPPAEAAALVGRIAAGVAAAHAAGIVHRDLKPGNILLTADGQAKVADFGLAKRGASDLTATQAVMGTPAYMSPEQAGGKTKFVGPQADVWALGVILYECVTGERPFAGGTTDEVLARVLAADPPAVRTIRPGVPRDLELICRKCLEREPHDRYPTAAELADDLARFGRGEPVLARPLGPVPRLARWAKRNPAVAGLLAAVVLVTVGLVVSLYGRSRQAVAQATAERAAREGAENARAQAEAAAASARRAADEARLREAAEASAARSATEADAFLGLLNDLFRSTDPFGVLFGDAAPALGVGGAPDANAAVLGPFLRMAAARFRDTLTGPDAAPRRAKLLAAIGNGMKSLGLFAEARPVLEEALALRRAHLPDPDRHPDVWQSELDLGRAESEGGDMLGGAARFRRVHALQKAAGAPPEALLTTRFYEGFALSTAGAAEAGAALREVVDGRQPLLGRTHKDTLLAKLGLITWHLETNDWAAAVQLFGEFRDDMRALPDARVRAIFEPVLDAQSHVAKGYLAKRPGSLFASALRPAVDGLRAAIGRLEKVIPEDHLLLCIFRYELAGLVADRAPAEADALYARVLADARRTVGLAHPKVLLLLKMYARRLADAGRAADARSLFDEVERANRARFGDDNPWLTSVLLQRAAFEQERGEPPFALSPPAGLLERAARARGQAGPAKSAACAADAVALVRRGKVLLTRGGMVTLFDTAKALGDADAPPALRAHARELYAALRPMVAQVYGPASNETCVLRTTEGRHYYSSGDRATAAACFADALALLPALPNLDPSEANTLLYWAGRLELDRGRPAEAEKHFRAALALTKRMPLQSASDREEDANAMANALVALGRFADAGPFLREARKLQAEQGDAEKELAMTDLRVASAALAAGDRAAYLTARDGMFKQYGPSKDMNVLSRVAWAAGLGGAPEGWDAGAFEARYAAALANARSFPWGFQGLALVRLRAGQLDQVEAALAKSGKAPHPLDHLIRGLAAAAGGDRGRAGAHLAEAEALAERQKPTAERPFANAGRLWHKDVEAAILLAELRAALLPEVAPPPRPR